MVSFFLRRFLATVLPAAALCLLAVSPGFAVWDHVLSPEAFFSVSPGVEYRLVQAAPDLYPGVTLMLAGDIAENSSTREGTTLEIVCYTRDRDDRPEELDPGCGRFLVKAPTVLDPEVYRAGRLVTLTGKFLGQETRPLGEKHPSYLVFGLGEIYLWPRPVEYRTWGRWPCDPWCDRVWDPWCDRPWDPWCDPFYRSRFGFGWWRGR
jgi:outer membrane lipoprotein